MDDGRPASLIAWIECESCGRIDKAAHDFNYPADMASDTAAARSRRNAGQQRLELSSHKRGLALTLQPFCTAPSSGVR
jgi:hypothetical protein